MRRSLSTLAVLTALAVPATARAEVAHVVAPGETLWSIASANNLTTNALAVYNGLSTSSQVVLGSTVMVPTTAEATAKLGATGLWAGADGETPAGTSTPTAPGAPAVQGGYTVRPGDTLSGLAAGAGVSVAEMAAVNGLDPSGVLVAGTVIKLPTGAPAPAGASEPAPAPVVAEATPHATSQTVDSATVSRIAGETGVSGSLASAIGWQESGFNNAMVSSANARGVMQVMPGTWDWVQQNLTSTQLNPDSAEDNVRAGTLYLRHLLDQTGGDENTAIAGYYQGLGSVQSRGNYDDTNQYVANVQALRGRFTQSP